MSKRINIWESVTGIDPVAKEIVERMIENEPDRDLLRAMLGFVETAEPVRVNSPAWCAIHDKPKARRSGNNGWRCRSCQREKDKARSARGR